MQNAHTDTVVIGGGIIGLATARAMALAGREVTVLEEQSAIGQGISSRSSEVIHAGIYYSPMVGDEITIHISVEMPQK